MVAVTFYEYNMNVNNRRNIIWLSDILLPDTIATPKTIFVSKNSLFSRINSRLLINVFDKILTNWLLQTVVSKKVKLYSNIFLDILPDPMWTLRKFARYIYRDIVPGIRNLRKRKNCVTYSHFYVLIWYYFSIDFSNQFCSSHTF